MTFEEEPKRFHTLETKEKISKSKGGANSRTAYHRASVRIMENKIDRKLQKGEVVHHIDGDSSNNLPNNLMLFKSKKEHNNYHRVQREKTNYNYKWKGRNKEYKREWYIKNKDRILEK